MCDCVKSEKVPLLENKFQFKVGQAVADLQNHGSFLHIVDDLFESTTTNTESFATSGITKEDLYEFKLNKDSLQSLLQDQQKQFALKLPDGSVATLLKRDIVSCDFKLDVADPENKQEPYDIGLHYQGALQHAPEDSQVALSFYQNGDIIGNVSSIRGGNFTLTPVNPSVSGTSEQTHLFYKEASDVAYSDRQCNTVDDHSVKYSFSELSGLETKWSATEASGKCVRMYLETGFDIYTGKNSSVQNVISFVTGLFNQVSLIYANANIPMKMSGLYVWNVQDPYPGTSTSTLLQQFQTYRKTFNGDIAQLLCLKENGKVAAEFSAYCNPDRAQSMCYSGISLSYVNIPTYSWTVYVVTHEAGHLLGLRHTHACVWNGNNTAIDGCAGYVEGDCPLPPLPNVEVIGLGTSRS